MTPEDRADAVIEAAWAERNAFRLRDHIAAAIRQAEGDVLRPTSAQKRDAGNALRGLLARLKVVEPPILPDTRWNGLTDLYSLVEGLICWLDLPSEAVGFIRHLCRDRLDDTTIAVFADWLEENGQTADGKAVRRLRIDPDNVLVLTVPHQAGDPVRLGQSVQQLTGCKGVLVLRDGDDLRNLPPQALADLGLVRREEVEQLTRDAYTQGVRAGSVLMPQQRAVFESIVNTP